ncbi:MAG: helix-turn-helix domain-containing protein [Alphaproteobacteria bacterium]
MLKDFKIHYEIGQKIKKFRKIAKISQTLLASKLGVSFQQLQKYEIGENQITADKLWKISKFLNIDIERFFLEKTEQKIYINDIQTTRFLRAYHKLRSKNKVTLLSFLENL